MMTTRWRYKLSKLKLGLWEGLCLDCKININTTNYIMFSEVIQCDSALYLPVRPMGGRIERGVDSSRCHKAVDHIHSLSLSMLCDHC